MEAHVKKSKPWMGFKWHCDEIRYMVLGGEAYLFMVVDYSTRFGLASMASPTKFGAKPLDMFREAASWAGVAP